MHGWWWPGRQVVVVVPCLVLAVAWWAAQSARARTLVAATAAFGVFTWTWLVAEVLTHRRTLIVDFEQTANPLYRAWRAVLPDYRHPSVDDWVLQAVWLTVLAVAVVAALRSTRSRSPSPQPPRPREPVPW
jgi:uncharacterized membrane protein YwzB